MSNRICNRCEKSKDLNSFTKHKRGILGRSTTCKECHNTYYEKNKIYENEKNNVTVQDLIDKYINSNSYTEFAEQLGYNYYNGTISKRLKKIIKENSLENYKILDGKTYAKNQLIAKGVLRRKYDRVVKKCPICGKKFETIKNTKERTTCSKQCGNKHFKTQRHSKATKNYQTICFRYHKKECIICKEKRIVAVHHFDENHENHAKENLIPLCPTHHQYLHSRHKHLIEKEVILYRDEFIKNNNIHTLVAQLVEQ